MGKLVWLFGVCLTALSVFLFVGQNIIFSQAGQFWVHPDSGPKLRNALDVDIESQRVYEHGVADSHGRPLEIYAQFLFAGDNYLYIDLCNGFLDAYLHQRDSTNGSDEFLNNDNINETGHSATQAMMLFLGHQTTSPLDAACAENRDNPAVRQPGDNRIIITVRVVITNTQSFVGNSYGPFPIHLFSGTIRQALSPGFEDRNDYISSSQIDEGTISGTTGARSSNSLTGYFYVDEPGNYSVYFPAISLIGEEPLKSVNVTMSSANAVEYILDGSNYFPAEEAASSTEQSASMQCTAAAGGFGWLICGLLELLDSGVKWFYAIVHSEMQVFGDSAGQPNQILSDTNADTNQIRAIWEGFRDLARLLLVLVLLFIVYAQITQSSVVEAYGVKKMLPRFAMAVIAIELSWIIFSWLAIFIEDIGRGVGAMLMDFTGNASRTVALDINLSGTQGAGMWIAIALGVGALISGAFFALIPLALSVFLAVLTAFIVVVFRKLLLIVLLAVSPIAILLWILPNTESLFKKWFEMYRNLLLMFPLIVLLIVMGGIVSQIGTSTAGIEAGTGFIDAKDQSNLVLNLVAIVAFFAPYFMIPFTFKWAAGAFGAAADFLGNMSKKATGALGENMKARRQLYNMKNVDKPTPKGKLRGMYRRKQAGLGLRESSKNPYSIGAYKETQIRSAAQKTMGELSAARISRSVQGMESPKDQAEELANIALGVGKHSKRGEQEAAVAFAQLLNTPGSAEQVKKVVDNIASTADPGQRQVLARAVNASSAELVKKHADLANYSRGGFTSHDVRGDVMNAEADKLSGYHSSMYERLIDGAQATREEEDGTVVATGEGQRLVSMIHRAATAADSSVDTKTLDTMIGSLRERQRQGAAHAGGDLGVTDAEVTRLETIVRERHAMGGKPVIVDGAGKDQTPHRE